MGTGAHTTGALVQTYIRAKRPGSGEDPTAAAARLDRQLKGRIDVLGFDDERLCEVAPEKVLAELERLEQEALLEDNRDVRASGGRRVGRRTKAGVTGQRRK
jgi:hypothetical protein